MRRCRILACDQDAIDNDMGTPKFLCLLILAAKRDNPVLDKEGNGLIHRKPGKYRMMLQSSRAEPYLNLVNSDFLGIAEASCPSALKDGLAFCVNATDQRAIYRYPVNTSQTRVYPIMKANYSRRTMAYCRGDLASLEEL